MDDWGTLAGKVPLNDSESGIDALKPLAIQPAFVAKQLHGRQD